jgi:sugar-specific transcriptional regulator TrmB
MVNLLVKLGLSEKEAQVYLAMLELAEDTAQNIAKKAGVNRATTYVIIEKLMQLGLASTVERGKKSMFIAESPTELVNLLEQQKHEIEIRRAQLDSSMAELMAVYNAHQDKPIVRYFEGADGLEALDRYGHDQFRPGSEVLAITPIDLIEKYFPARRKTAINDRIDRKMISRVIYTHQNGEIADYINEKELRSGVFLPREQFDINETIAIYPDWGVKIYNYDPKNFFGVLIQSPDLARNLMVMFNLALEAAKEKKKRSK